MTVDGKGGPLTAARVDLIDAWWRAANYLSVGQIYLLDKPAAHRGTAAGARGSRGLLGHWGTTTRAQT